MWLLNWLGTNVRLRYLIEVTVKLNRVGSPDGLEHLQEFICHRAALLEVRTSSIHLVLVPAESQAHTNPALGKKIKGCQATCQHDRVVVRNIEDTRTESNFPGTRRRKGQRLQGSSACLFTSGSETSAVTG